MAFIPFPVYSVNATEEEIELKESLKQPIDYEESTIWVNPAHITDFCEQENNYVLIFLSNGRNYTVLKNIEEFLDIIDSYESIINLNDISDN